MQEAFLPSIIFINIRAAYKGEGRRVGGGSADRNTAVLLLGSGVTNRAVDMEGD